MGLGKNGLSNRKGDWKCLKEDKNRPVYFWMKQEMINDMTVLSDVWLVFGECGVVWKAMGKGERCMLECLYISRDIKDWAMAVASSLWWYPYSSRECVGRKKHARDRMMCRKSSRCAFVREWKFSGWYRATILLREEEDKEKNDSNASIRCWVSKNDVLARGEVIQSHSLGTGPVHVMVEVFMIQQKVRTWLIKPSLLLVFLQSWNSTRHDSAGYSQELILGFVLIRIWE